jgi:hypothetical protein
MTVHRYTVLAFSPPYTTKSLAFRLRQAFSFFALELVLGTRVSGVPFLAGAFLSYFTRYHGC